MMSAPAGHYRRPGWLLRRVINPSLVGLTRAGVSLRGGRILEVRGRQSGQPRRTPVNLLDFEEREYLVSPRGNSQWVRNVRADGGRLALLLGSRRDERIATEVADSEKPPILREYLRRWKMEVGAFFGGVSADSPEEDIRRIAPDHPVFVLSEPTDHKIDPNSTSSG
jgi:deazaflavin-dependent oxidoreductase (nitroreductase family)